MKSVPEVARTRPSGSVVVVGDESFGLREFARARARRESIFQQQLGFALVLVSHDLALVEDSAQAHFARLHGQNLGTFGRAGIGSFTNGKTISSLYGGVILSDEERMLVRQLNGGGVRFGPIS